MGRRKIEIQPITHERNRSVTFLKRKNGLFKKAYELGVLCSVDVAVIIFEERPGHHAKLYQYCSTDVNSMVQRHLRFDGERDTKGPPDFSNNNNKVVDEAGDDDDEVDDDDLSQKQRRDSKSTKVKVENSATIVPIRPGPPDVSASPDMDYRSSLRVSPTASTSSSSLAISGERHLSANTSAARSIPISSTAKRQRIDDGSHGIPSAPPGLGPNSNHMGSPTFPYRIDIELPSYASNGTPIMPSLSQLHSQHPSLSALYSPGGAANGMQSMMGGAQPNNNNNNAFLAGSPFDLPRGALRAVSFPSSGSSQYSPQQQQQQQLFARPHGGGGASHASSIFADLLGAAAGEQHAGGGGGGGHGGAGAPQFPSFDWPVHTPSQGAPQSGQGQHENGQGSPQSDNNWFDFLSAPTSSGPTQQSHSQSHSQSSQGQGGGLALPPPVPPLNSARYAVGSPPGMGRKRLRDDGSANGNGASDSGESMSDGRRSAGAVNGNGEGRKS